MCPSSLVPSNDLSVSKIVNNPFPTVGSNVTFTITAQNVTGSTETNARVNDLLPAGYTYVSHTTATGTYNQNTGVWNIGSLSTNNTVTLSIVARVNGYNNAINTATITGDVRDINLSNNTSNAAIAEPCLSSLATSGTWTGTNGSSTIAATASSVIGTGTNQIAISMNSAAVSNTSISGQSDSPLNNFNGYLNATTSTNNTGGLSGLNYYYYTPNLTFKNALKFEVVYANNGVMSSARNMVFTLNKPVKSLILNVDRLGGGLNGLSTSAKFTLINPALNISVLKSNSKFILQNKSFFRLPNEVTGTNSEVDINNPSNGTAAGSLLISTADGSTFTTFTLSITGEGPISSSGITSDGVEFIFELCTSIACYKPATVVTGGSDTKHGITSLQRAGTGGDNWPMVRKGAYTALEADTKGFVINRLTTAQINKIVTDGKAVEGMAVYDLTVNCMKIYDGTSFKCYNTPSCDQ